MTPSFQDEIAKLPEAIREAVLERAAIMEYCSNLPRAEAEWAALTAQQPRSSRNQLATGRLALSAVDRAGASLDRSDAKYGDVTNIAKPLD